MNDQFPEVLEETQGGSRPSFLFGYMALSLFAGLAVWGAIFSVSLVNLGIEPVQVASAVFDIERPSDDSIIVASDAELFRIQPAAGPAHGCE